MAVSKNPRVTAKKVAKTVATKPAAKCCKGGVCKAKK
jgi:hypothetical protein